MTDDKRRYEIVVFGASGVTGKYVIEEIALHHEGINWCIAGRNRDKLKESLKEIGDELSKYVFLSYAIYFKKYNGLWR